MAEQLLDQVRDLIDGQIDFQGQSLAEEIGTYSLILAGILSFLIGYIKQDIILALWIGLGGAAVSIILVVPPWPFYNKNPLKWLPVDSPSTHTDDQPETIIYNPSAL